MSCPPLSESAPEGPSVLLSLLLLLLLVLLLLLLLPRATTWCSMSLLTMGILINLTFRGGGRRCYVVSTLEP